MQGWPLVRAWSLLQILVVILKIIILTDLSNLYLTASFLYMGLDHHAYLRLHTRNRISSSAASAYFVTNSFFNLGIVIFTYLTLHNKPLQGINDPKYTARAHKMNIFNMMTIFSTIIYLVNKITNDLISELKRKMQYWNWFLNLDVITIGLVE